MLYILSDISHKYGLMYQGKSTKEKSNINWSKNEYTDKEKDNIEQHDVKMTRGFWILQNYNIKGHTKSCSLGRNYNFGMNPMISKGKYEIVWIL